MIRKIRLSRDADVHGAARHDDAALMQRAALGDPSALAELYDRHAPTLLATAVRMLGEREARDVLHDVFIEAWSHASDYTAERGSVRTWLLVRLRSRALDRLGGADRTRTCPLDANDELPASRAFDTAHPPTIDGIAVRAALQHLGTDVREALELCYFGGLTLREIAERKGVPLGTIKSRIARGLNALSSLLDVEKDSHDD